MTLTIALLLSKYTATSAAETNDPAAEKGITDPCTEVDYLKELRKQLEGRLGSLSPAVADSKTLARKYRLAATKAMVAEYICSILALVALAGNSLERNEGKLAVATTAMREAQQRIDIQIGIAQSAIAVAKTVVGAKTDASHTKASHIVTINLETKATGNQICKPTAPEATPECKHGRPDAAKLFRMKLTEAAKLHEFVPEKTLVPAHGSGFSGGSSGSQGTVLNACTWHASDGKVAFTHGNWVGKPAQTQIQFFASNSARTACSAEAKTIGESGSQPKNSPTHSVKH
uniref:Variant surface glycoprotein 1755 n=1 Tax=Trypanosoma brucei TaxID=5691 RepID=M4TCD0_9TRYP|nr:variant surface glycoprotein 1755 [Trypanosoma brucei]